MKDLGGMTIYKGKLGDVQLIMWDALPDCTEECDIYFECPYVGGSRQRNKCEMRRRYLEAVMQSLDKGIKEVDEITSLTVGLLIAPLFQHLISFKIFTHGMGHNIMVGKKIHPVYKEIRQTIKEINLLLKELGLTKGGIDKTLLNGNSSYYDDMIQHGNIPA